MQYASPATVSRAGMVYVDPKNLGFEPFMDKWIRSRIPEEQEFLTSMFEKYVQAAVNLIIEGWAGMQQVTPLQMIIPQTALNMVNETTLICISLIYFHYCQTIILHLFFV